MVALLKRALRLLVGFVMLASLFVGVSIGTAAAAGEGHFHDWRQNNYWGHLYHGWEDDCMWMNHAIYQDGPGGSGPNLYTYGSIDGARISFDGKQRHVEPCKDIWKELPNQHIQVKQHLGHWLGWANTWAWCNNGPWVANGEPDGWDHDAVTGFHWSNPPCMDQSTDQWYFGWHEQWHAASRWGGELLLRALSDWLWIHW